MNQSPSSLLAESSVSNSSVAQSQASRKIIHCDADCFFAAIEMRDDPSLRTRPIAIGGAADRRGVIATCNYEARAYGVRSAMASATALRLCPDLIMIPPNMAKYRLAAEQIRDLFFEYSDQVEPLSLDEAFIDVTDSEWCRGSATLIAQSIRQRVLDEVGITVSAGVAPNKFLAKIASDWNKPDGLWVITPDQVDTFTRQLAIGRLSGVGKVTADKLHRLGIQTCDDLRRFSVVELSRHFGKLGLRLHELSFGIDNHPVKTSRQRKSLSVEHTYTSDVPSVAGCLGHLPTLFSALAERLNSIDRGCRISKQFVKVKFNNFQSTTMECVCGTTPRMAVFRDLCRQSVLRGDGLPVRLLGLGVRFHDNGGSECRQLSLFAE